MNMTHYMELLATNQPWNLLIFMAGPVILAETVAITEMILLYKRRFDGPVRTVNKTAGILVGFYFLGIIVWLFTHAVVPITEAAAWRTFVDVFAVGAYLLSGVPLILVALQDLGLIQKKLPDEKKLAWHISYIAAFLVIGHLAMIAGMADPGIFGYQATSAGHETPARIEHDMPSHEGH